MKKIFYTFLMILAVFTLVSCGKEDPVDPPVDPPVVDTTDPLFFGVADTVINVGDAFDPLDGVTAIDDKDGNITSSIVVSGTYDVNVAGVYTITYTVEDAAGNEATQSMQLVVRVEPESELYVTNGDFSEPLDSTWTHWSGDGGTSTATIVDGVLNYDITANGAQWWSSQFSQPNLTVPQGVGFILEFEARADVPRGMYVKLENPQYIGYVEGYIELTTEWQTFELEFYVTLPTIETGKLIFGAGNMTNYSGGDAGALTTIYLDNIKFIELEPTLDEEAPVIIGATDKIIGLNEPFNPLLGVTITDNQDIDLTVEDIVITGTVDNTTPGDYVLTYTLTDASGNETQITRTITVLDGIVPSTWVFVNGDFEVDQLAPLAQPADTGWGWHGAGTFTALIDDGMAIIDIEKLGTVPYGVQFYQQNRIIEQGRIYELTFEARSDIPRPMQVALEEGTSRRFDTIVDLTTEWQTFTIQIDHILPGYTNGKFAFFLGLIGSTSVPTTVYIDNVSVETVAEVTDTHAPVLRGIDDYIIALNSTFDPLNNVKLFEDHDEFLTIDDVVVTGTVDTATVGVYDLTYTVEDASGNEAIYTRTIEVLDPINMLDSTLNIVNGDFSVDQSTPYDQPAMDGWGWHGGGTFTVMISEGIMTQVISDVGTVPYGTQFYQQNLVVETQATYRVTFKAKVDLERAIKFSLEMGTTGQYSEVIDITTDWATYEIIFTIPEYGFNNAKFAFFAGLVESDSPATTFYLDDIEIELIGYLKDTDAPMIFGTDDKVIEQGLEFDPLVGVEVFDLIDKSLKTDEVVVTGTVDVNTPGYYTLSYSITDRQGNEAVATRIITVTESSGGLPSTLKIINGDFEEAQTAPAAAGTGWGWHGSGKFTVDISSGYAAIEVYETWNMFYGVQFYILNRELIEGHTYLITFSAKADDARPLQLNLESGGAKFSAFFNLGQDWATYTYEYTHTSASITNGKFSFFVGNIHSFSTPTTVYLDDVVVTRIEEPSLDTEAPQIWGALDTIWLQGETFDPMLGLRVYDHVDKTLLVEDITYTGSVDTLVVGNYDIVYTLTDASGNTLTHTRIISVVAAVDMADQRINLTDGDFELQQPITNTDANPGWTLKAGTGTGIWTNAFVDGHLEIDISFVGTVPHSIQFFQRNSFTFEAHSTYVISFKAKADVARDIRIILENPSENYANYTLHQQGLTTEWVTYEFVLHNGKLSTADAKIGFFLGLIDAEHPELSAATKVYFDDVSVQLIGYVKDTVSPMVFGADVSVEQNAVFNPMTGLLYGDFAKNPTVVVSSVTAGLVTYDEPTKTYSVDTSVLGDYTITYTVTDYLGNVTTFDRIISVIEPVTT